MFTSESARSAAAALQGMLCKSKPLFLGLAGIRVSKGGGGGGVTSEDGTVPLPFWISCRRLNIAPVCEVETLGRVQIAARPDNALILTQMQSG